jgi:hypothetical protein
MIAPIALLLIVVAFRVFVGIGGSGDMHGLLHNFSPIAAIALCGAVYLPRRIAVVLPILALLLSDIALNLFYKVSFFTPEILPRYFALVLVSALGFALRGKVRLPGLLAGSVAGSLLFYVITNTGSWLADSAYAKTAAGWLQALTVGTGNPAYPPTWWFYRHTAASDIVFTLLFVCCLSIGRKKTAESAAGAPVWAR